MNPAEFGAAMASFVLCGVLPAAFVAYGRSNGKTWGVALGLILAGLFMLSAIQAGNFDIGLILGLALVAFAYSRKSKEPPQPPAPPPN